jgi:GH15 family glucan-1,4-alpha-glucosidase
MYGIDGRQKLDELTLDHLRGYEYSSPVRIGNAARQQLQLNIYGEMMDSIYLADKYGDPISYAGWQDMPVWETRPSATSMYSIRT